MMLDYLGKITDYQVTKPDSLRVLGYLKESGGSVA